MSQPGPAVEGYCDARFAAVRETFARGFREGAEVGAAVAVLVDGRPVVDLWGGFADRARRRPWRRDTLVNVFSVGKPMAAIAALSLVEQGRLRLDAPVERAWPGFAVAGKEGITLRTLLSHRAGLPGVRAALRPGAMFRWTEMTAALAAERPWWEPDSGHGYHVNTFGFLVGELVRRASGEGFGAFFRRTVAGPLGADFHFGLAREHDARTAEHLLPGDDSTLVDLLLATEPAGDTAGDTAGASHAAARRRLLHAAYVNPPGLSGFGVVNTREWRAAELPSSGGHANARAVARIYAALARGGEVDGVRLLSTSTIDEATAEASAGDDLVLGRPSRFGLGFQLTRPGAPLGASARAFGHFGAGGSLGFADPDARLAFGYTTSLPGPRMRDPRTRALIDAVYAAS